MGCCASASSKKYLSNLPNQSGLNISSGEQGVQEELYASGPVLGDGDAFEGVRVVHSERLQEPDAQSSPFFVDSEALYSCQEIPDDSDLSGIIVTATEAQCIAETPAHHKARVEPLQSPVLSIGVSTRASKRAVLFKQVARPSPLPPNVCSNLPVGSPQGKGSHLVLNDWGFLAARESLQHLRTGGALFSCVPAAPGTKLGGVERAMCTEVLGLTSFRDELNDNGVRKVDMQSQEDLSKLLYGVSKGTWLLPEWSPVAGLTPGRFASYDFQLAIAPDGTKVVKQEKVFDRDGKRAVDAFCVKRDIVMWFSVTTQYKVSAVPPESLPRLAALSDGAAVDKAFLCERTRSDYGTDATITAKMLFLFHRCPERGALVTQIQVTVFKSLPGIARSLLGKMAKRGAEEAGQVALKIRHLLK